MNFLDTSYLGALFMENDQWHAAAVEWSRFAAPPFLTTDYVILELADGLARAEWRRTFAVIFDFLRGSSDTRIVPQSRELFDRGIALYCARNDKGWSLTDCLSFTVMRDAGCTDALTADAHFVQAGFRALLRESPE